MHLGLELASIIREEQKKQGLSFAQIGRMAETTPETVRHYANLRRKPTLEIADRILKVLGRSMVIGGNNVDV